MDDEGGKQYVKKEEKGKKKNNADIYRRFLGFGASSVFTNGGNS